MKQQGVPSVSDSRSLLQQKSDLLQAVSFTNNGKSATPQKQQEVLGIVGAIEADASDGSDLFTNKYKLELLDGTWYLQYTSPSTVGDKDEFPVSGSSWSVSQRARAPRRLTP